MKIRTVLAGLAAATSLVAFLVVPASASATFSGFNDLFSDFSYDGTKLVLTNNGGPHITSGDIFGNNQVGDTLVFSSGSLVNSGTLVGSSVQKTQVLTGGTFTLLSSTSAPLLTGNFFAGLLSGFPGFGFNAESLALLNINYTGGLYWNAATSNSPPFFNPGSLSVSLNSTTPLTDSNGTTFDPFVASGGGNFSAQNSPEPASVVTFAFGALGLIALVLRGRKSQRTMNLGA